MDEDGYLTVFVNLMLYVIDFASCQELFQWTIKLVIVFIPKMRFVLCLKKKNNFNSTFIANVCHNTSVSTSIRKYYCIPLPYFPKSDQSVEGRHTPAIELYLRAPHDVIMRRSVCDVLALTTRICTRLFNCSTVLDRWLCAVSDAWDMVSDYRNTYVIDLSKYRCWNN